MRTYTKQFIRNFDFPLFFTYLVLCLFGLVMIYSSSLVWAVGRYKFEPDYFFNRQLVNLAVAFPVFFLAAFFPYKNYKRKKLMIYSVVGMLALLFSVHFLGGGENLGAQRSINLSIAGKRLGNIQPSEFAKLILLVYFASIFAKKSDAGTLDNINQSIGPPIIVLILAVGSVMLETDIGTSFIIIISALSVLAASGIKRNTFWKLSGFITIGLLFASLILYFKWETIMTESRTGRLLSYLNPFDYIQGSGFQIANGYIAIGSGGVKGHGLGNSIQKMGYLPEPHTDVIMAVISEELGILGVIIVVGGLGFIVLRALAIALKAKDPHARMLAAGIGSMIGIQTFVNLGGLTGLIPLTGVPLPFISYGGTSVILMSIAMGILMNVSMFVKYEKNK